MINEFFMKLFSDNNTSIMIEMFSIWHILYMVIIIGTAVALCFYLKDKSDDVKEKIVNRIAILLFASYMLDFFCMPLSEDKINIDKLPFHICTLSSILILFTRFNSRFKKFRAPVLILGLVGTLMYLCYPSSAFHDYSAFSYVVLQTFLYHGLLLIYGVVAIACKNVELNWKKFYEVPILMALMVVWASIGNAVYSKPDSPFDWAFIRGRNFPVFPENLNFLMPYAVIFAFVGSAALIYALVINLIPYLKAKLTKKQND